MCLLFLNGYSEKQNFVCEREIVKHVKAAYVVYSIPNV